MFGLFKRSGAMSELLLKCAKCGASCPSDAKFCSACGNPFAVQLPPQAPPQASAPPQAPAASGFGGAGGAAFSSGFGASNSASARSVHVPLDANAAFAAFGQAIVDLGGEIRFQSAPQQLRFVLPYKDLWLTGNFPVKFVGQVSLAPDANGGTNVATEASIDGGSLAPLIAVTFLLFLFMVGYGLISGYYIPLLAVATAYGYFKLNGDKAEELTRSLVARAQAVAAAR